MNAKPEQLSAEADESRYVIERKLGEGGAGAVYLAKDRETGEFVALKKLFRMDAKSVLRLKREFRSLVDINDPNIVKLYDMGRARDGWFLTMEYVEGVDLTTYLTRLDTGTTKSSVEQAHARLLSSFTQLARGIQVLHQAGMLHRDLKPNNVLVVDHRVVVLDFGLVRELSGSSSSLTEDGSVAGTPAYMAPEQIMGHELGTASDWYAFGVMLYEALSGLLPIDGPMLALLRAKVETDPVPIHDLAKDARQDVLDLCMALLRRDPTLRPNADDIIAVLSRGERVPPKPVPISQTGTENTFHTETEPQLRNDALFGRERELSALWKAFAQTHEGHTVFAHVRGASGAGKSALLEHFLDNVEDSTGLSTKQQDTLVLRSRCYELEAMPFKALDGVVDALVRDLSHLDDLQVAHVLPPDIAALTRLFPALERLGAVKRLAAVSRSARDAVVDRQRAEVAMRTLLDSVAMRKPIVIWIDDLQWGDLDSARILQDWLNQPGRAPILFVFSYRSEEITTSSCLMRLLQREPGAPLRAADHTIDVAELGSHDIRALCERRLGALGRLHPDVLERIVREAQGSPFLASQLTAVAEAKLARGDTDWNGLTIDALVAQTSGLLPPEARKLLTVLAVAGKPIAPKLALHASGIRRHGRSLVHALRGLNLVRTRDIGGERMLEVYHDRVRESVQAALTNHESVLIHGSLLSTLEFSGQADPDWMHTLAFGAGQRTSALTYGHAAAERAKASLAFERAAELYRRCIDLAEPDAVANLWSKLAVVLGLCGRGMQAADAYLEAAKLVPAREAVALTQLAAAHLLRSGRFEEGEALVRKVLIDLGIGLPAGDRNIKAAIAWERTRLTFRGMGYRLRSVEEAPPELLAKHDMYEALSSAAHQYDALLARLFQLRGLRCALDAGEPERLVQSLSRAATAAILSPSARSARDAEAALEQAEKLAREAGLDDLSVVTAARAVTSYLFGRHQEALKYSEDVMQRFATSAQTSTRANYYRRHLVTAVHIGVLYQLARYEQFVAELNDLLREARATDNRSLVFNLTHNQTRAEEILDQCAASRPRLDEQRRGLPNQRFGMLHGLHLCSVLSAACSTREHGWALETLEADWPGYQRSDLDHGGWTAMAIHAARARLFLNRYALDGGDRRVLDTARSDLRWLTKHGSKPAAKRVAARLAHFAGDDRNAVELLRESSNACDESKMPAEAALDRHALGALLGGDEGAALCRDTERRLRELGAVNPRAMLRAFYPEFVESE